ncbi:MAG: hypothetical protein ABIA63_14470 [bacterium]
MLKTAILSVICFFNILPIFSKTLVVDSAANPGIQVSIFMRPLTSGDTLIIKPGTYTETAGWRVPEGVTIIGESGPDVTRIVNIAQSNDGFVLNSNCTLKGLNLTNKLGRENLVRIHDVKNVLVQDCIIHDAGPDGDCIKVTTSGEIHIDHCIIYNPGLRSSGYNQECVDFFTVKKSSITNSWLFDRSTSTAHVLCYPKAGSGDILYEGNIFGPMYGNGTQFGGSNWGSNPEIQVPYSCENQIMRNNIFLDIKGTVVTIFEPKNCYFNNNIVYNCGVVFDYGTSMATADEARNGWIYNNIFYNDRGNMKYIYAWRPTDPVYDFTMDYNLYYNNGTSVAYGYQTKGSHGFEADPQLVNPRLPFTALIKHQNIEEIKSWFKLKQESPAVDKGIAAISGAVLFDPGKDFLNNARTDGKIDLGPHEYGTVSYVLNNDIRLNSKIGFRAWQSGPYSMKIFLNNTRPSFLNLLNIRGQLIKSQKLNHYSNASTFNWNNLPTSSGLYVVELKSGMERTVDKVRMVN